MIHLTRRSVAAALLLAATAAAFGGAPAAPQPPAPPVAWKHYLVRSPATGKIERFWVGRAAALKADGKYPTVYFLPGLLDTEDHWKAALEPHLGRHEMVAVCPSVGGGAWFMNSPAQPWMKWGDFLTDELRAFVEANYPASHAKGQRGIVGISAGGHGALYHALQRPELYGAVSVLSGAMELRGYAGQVGLEYWIGPRTPEAMPLYAERSVIAIASRQDGPLPFNLNLEAGDKDGALAQMVMLRQVLDRRQVPYDWTVAPGGHDWTFWKSRTPAQLAWFDEAFTRNRQEGRFPEEPPAASVAPLEVLKDLPDVALTQEATRRLRAEWRADDGRRISVTGLPPEGAPLALNDPKAKEVRLKSALDARGHGAGLHLYRLTVTAGTPLEKGGSIALTLRLVNGRNMGLVSMPAATLPVPDGQKDRRVEWRARLALEFKEPDPLRGGIACGLQVFGADGTPAGDPLVGKAKPGSANAEFWPIAPEAQAEWTFTLLPEKGVGLAAVYDVRLEVEPPGE